VIFGQEIWCSRAGNGFVTAALILRCGLPSVEVLEDERRIGGLGAGLGTSVYLVHRGYTPKLPKSIRFLRITNRA
jgi:hypothetical protein